MRDFPPRPIQITQWHLDGEAWVYVRQSSLAQLREQIGSTFNQEEVVDLLKAWGFAVVRLITADQGLSGTSTRKRLGWQAMIEGMKSEVVRFVAGSEIPRLGRSLRELLDLIAVAKAKGVLLLENGIVRDVRQEGDWVTTVILAALAEQENMTRTRRTQTSRLAKARRGFLTTKVPPGLVRTEGGFVVKTDDPEDRSLFERIWREALQSRAAWSIAKGLREDGLQIPVMGTGPNRGKLVRRPATFERVHRILRNPIYASQVVIWRTVKADGDSGKTQRRTHRGEQQWVPGQIDGYVTLPEFERVQALLAARRSPSHIPPRGGRALCQGLILCETCHRHLSVSYRRTNLGGHSYVCYTSKTRGQEGETHCTTVCGVNLDERIEKLVLTILSCPSREALCQTIQEENERRSGQRNLLIGKVERSRRIAAEVERALDEARALKRPAVIEHYHDKFQAALSDLHDAERALNAAPPVNFIEVSESVVTEMIVAFRKLPEFWRSGLIDIRERKLIIRQVIREIHAYSGIGTKLIEVHLHSGDTVQLEVHGRKERHTLVEQLAAEGKSLADIARELNARGMVTVCGRPYRVASVISLLRKSPQLQILRDEKRRYRELVRGEFRKLWEAALPREEIAEQMNARGFLTEGGNAFTPRRVYGMGHRLGLKSRRTICSASLEQAVTELFRAGLSDEAIAAELNAQGIKGSLVRTWNRRSVRDLRRSRRLGLRHPGAYGLSRKKSARTQPDNTSSPKSEGDREDRSSG